MFLFNLSNGQAKKAWTVDLKSSPPAVVEGSSSKPDVTITVSDDDYVGLASGSCMLVR